LLPAPAAATPLAAMRNEPILPVMLGVTGILLFAIPGRFTARRLGQPSVPGELIMGVLPGNLAGAARGGLDLRAGKAGHQLLLAKQGDPDGTRSGVEPD